MKRDKKENALRIMEAPPVWSPWAWVAATVTGRSVIERTTALRSPVPMVLSISRALFSPSSR